MGADHVHIPLMVIEDGCLATVECYRRVETLEVIMPHEPLTFAVGALAFNKRFLLRLREGAGGGKRSELIAAERAALADARKH